MGIGGAVMMGSAAGAGSTDPPAGFRHFLGEPARRFQWRGTDPRRDPAGRKQFERDMAVLATAMEGAPEPRGKGRLHAGYTYALQLVAHDLVDTTRSFWRTDAGEATRNRLTRPLHLRTLYGAGPAEFPQAYAPDPNSRDMPIAFRLDNAVAGAKEPTPSPAGRDVPRPTMTLLADTRNDQHLLLSQTTMLFMALHNAILATLPEDQSAPEERACAAEARFTCVEAATVLIYREVLRNDILPRILHPAVRGLYRAQAPILEQAEQRREMPLEFSHGAFRFGHALVRGDYHLRHGKAPADTHPLGRLLKRNSEFFGQLFPLDTTWLLDWAAFLPLHGSEEVANMARPIGATSNPLFKQDSRFGSILKGIGTGGLALRDLLSAGLAGTWSVWALIEAIRRHPDGAALSPLLALTKADWKSGLQAWRGRIRAGKPSPALMQGLEDDPPLFFFILLEAESSDDAGLGVLGSIIVAETILGALARDRPPAEQAPGDLRARLRMTGAIHGFEETMAALPAIDTLPGMLRFLADQPHWKAAIPPLFSAAPAAAG